MMKGPLFYLSRPLLVVVLFLVMVFFGRTIQAAEPPSQEELSAMGKGFGKFVGSFMQQLNSAKGEKAANERQIPDQPREQLSTREQLPTREQPNQKRVVPRYYVPYDPWGADRSGNPLLDYDPWSADDRWLGNAWERRRSYDDGTRYRWYRERPYGTRDYYEDRSSSRERDPFMGNGFDYQRYGKFPDVPSYQRPGTGMGWGMDMGMGMGLGW